MSDMISMTVFGATYDSVDAAEVDYQAVKDLYYGLDLMDTFDAAVIRKTEEDKVKIVKKHEQPTRQGALRGAGWGLAIGLVAALFPAVTLGAGLLAVAGGSAGAVTGALAGHVVGGMSRADLKEIGEELDKGQAGLVVVAATDVGDRVVEVIKSAEKVINKQIKSDEKELNKVLKEVEKA